MPEKGKVKWFSNVKGFGFLQKEGEERDVFVHYASIQGDGYKTLKQDEEVTFDIVDGERGPQAKNVIRLKKPPKKQEAEPKAEQETKQAAKQEKKQEAEPEAEQETKQAAKQEEKQEAEPKAEQETKQEAKQEAKEASPKKEAPEKGE